MPGEYDNTTSRVYTTETFTMKEVSTQRTLLKDHVVFASMTEKKNSITSVSAHDI